MHSRTSSEVTQSLSDYIEDLKDVQKENFDMKLKVFFLEERLGVGIGGESMRKLSEDNIELKVFDETLLINLLDILNIFIRLSLPKVRRMLKTSLL